MNTKIALVTGVSDGIGAAFARLLINNGWYVIGISRNREKLKINLVANYKHLFLGELH